MGDLREPKEERPVPPLSTSPLNPSPSSIGPECWARAEKATQKIICKVQPTAVSEERRREVIDYVQRLIRGCLGCEVFPYGSVPLKTYLPDGDIDLTAFGGANVEDALAGDMVSVLEGEDQNRAAEFVVKDVQLIRAEVKLVKCIVQNIVVDISFNQIGGLCTLCFLEQVDRFIGKDHLFKRSIILIKTWCYYESRILGAHHGLISTYALETLVLYIFHFFHSTLHGPLAVLYKFLDYFSKFDWDNYCISLTGPVCVSSSPEIVADAPENGGGDCLLSNDFLKYCTDMFSVPSKGVDVTSRTFPQKHLNIIDPLKENNNLGRSVSKGNFYRIRSAFTYGARKLGRILSQPEDKIADELGNFFSNTLDRHGSGQRPDVQDLAPMSSDSGFGPALSISETESCQDEKVISELKSTNRIGSNGDCKFNPDGSSLDRVNNIQVAGMKTKFSKTYSGQQRDSEKASRSTMLLEADGYVKENALLGYRCSGDAKELATSRIQGFKISNHSSEVSPRSSSEEGISPLGIPHHAPHLYFSNSILGNGKMKHEDADKKQLEKCGLTVDKDFSGEVKAPEGTGILIGHSEVKNLSVGNQEVLISVGTKDVSMVPTPVTCSEDSRFVNLECASSSDRNPDYLNSLSDISGDYDSHLNCLQYGRRCYEHALSVPTLPMPPPLPSQFQNKNSWDAFRHSSQFKRNGHSHVTVNGVIHANGVIPSPAFYHVNPLLIQVAAFGLEEMPKPRGTGTYFPNMNRPPQGYRPSIVKGRNQAPARSPRNSSRAVTFTEANILERSSHEQSQLQLPIDQGGGKPGSSDIHLSGSPVKKINSSINGLTFQSEGVVEFGSVGHLPPGAPLVESSRQARPPASSLNQTSDQGLVTPGMQMPKPVLGMNQDRAIVNSSYHLKDEDDFPPLTV